MKNREIALCRRQVRDILQEQDEEERIEELKGLARRIGAGTENTRIGAASVVKGNDGSTTTTIHQTPISEHDLICGINNALQTESMINVAGRSFYISIIAIVVSVVSAAAAWIVALGHN